MVPLSAVILLESGAEYHEDGNSAMRTIHLKNVLEMPEHIDWHVKTKNTTYSSSLKKKTKKEERVLHVKTKKASTVKGGLKETEKRSVCYATTKRY